MDDKTNCNKNFQGYFHLTMERFQPFLNTDNPLTPLPLVSQIILDITKRSSVVFVWKFFWFLFPSCLKNMFQIVFLSFSSLSVFIAPLKKRKTCLALTFCLTKSLSTVQFLQICTTLEMFERATLSNDHFHRAIISR